jgi:hypothetical protein
MREIGPHRLNEWSDAVDRHAGMLKLIADQAVAVADQNRPQPLLLLADKVQDEKVKRTLLAMVEAMRASKDIASAPTRVATSG